MQTCRNLGQRHPGRYRRGATMVESAIVLQICLLLLLGMLEVSVALVQNTVMSEVACRVARAAIVHGGKASLAQGAWGPAGIRTHGDSNDPAATAARDVMMAIDPADVAIDLDWIDGGNRPDQRVRVTVRYTHRPIIAIPGWYEELPLVGMSTMRIAH